MSHTLGKNLIHLVFSTKGRKPFLADPEIRAAMFRYLNRACNGQGCISLCVGGTADHVHLLCYLGKRQSVAGVVSSIKKTSSKWIKGKGESLRDFYWQRGYAFFSISPDRKERLIRYIENQMEHHQKTDFQKEMKGLFKAYEITYDATTWEGGSGAT